MAYVNIEGFDVFIIEPYNDTDVFVCNKYDYYEKNNDNSMKYIAGHWVSRDKYERRLDWFPYSSNDHKLIRYEKLYDFNIGKTIERKIEILHPPMYWDINGNRLPDNSTVDIEENKKENFDINEFNFYSGGMFANIATAFIIIAILMTIFINGGWGVWLFLIPYLIYGYNKCKKYVGLYTNNK